MSVLWILSLASFTCLALADYNFSVPLSGPNITFVGPNWLPEQAAGPCSTALGRFTGSPGEYVTLLFSGNLPLLLLFIDILRINILRNFQGVGVYVVSFLQGDSSLVVAAIDGNSFSIDPRQSASPSCAILFSQSGLSNTMHNLTMMHNGPISHLILHIADILYVAGHNPHFPVFIASTFLLSHRVARPGDAPPGLTQSTTPSPTTFTPITFVPTDNASRTNSVGRAQICAVFPADQ